MTTTNETTAEWNGQVYAACAPDGESWVSADGDEWFIGIVGGEYIQMESSRIVLVGGPRDGEVVA